MRGSARSVWNEEGKVEGGPGTYGMGREGASQKRRGERSERLGGYLLRDGRGWRGCRQGAYSSNMYNPLHPTSCPSKKRKKSRFSRHSSFIRKDTKVTLKSLIEQPRGGGEPRIQSKHGFVSWENRSVDTPPSPALACTEASRGEAGGHSEVMRWRRLSGEMRTLGGAGCSGYRVAAEVGGGWMGSCVHMACGCMWFSKARPGL